MIFLVLGLLGESHINAKALKGFLSFVIYLRVMKISYYHLDCIL